MSAHDNMRRFSPKDLSPTQILELLIGGIGPRPIALVSTISKEGLHNLAPFSFFNAFGSNPPTVVFSAARRNRDGTTKDTHDNLIKTRECVIQVVTYDMVEQVNLSSGEFDRGVDEFVKSGLTPLDSELVKAKRVKESPFHMECRLSQMIPLGKEPGSGNLAICEVLLFHTAEHIFEKGLIHPHRIDLVGRNGGAFYTRAQGSALFEIQKPRSKKIIGYDGLPEFMKKSTVFSANNLGRFSNTETPPSRKEILRFIETIENSEKASPPSENPSGPFSKKDFSRFHKHNDYHNMLKAALSLHKKGMKDSHILMEKTAKCALESGDIEFAWKTALYSNERF